MKDFKGTQEELKGFRLVDNRNGTQREKKLLLETLSELIRVVSFTFRLFGNMLAGEILILVSAFLIPFIFSVPFYGLELLVGFIQAMIFAGLTVTFAAVAVAHHEE